jgi:aminoglycoside phosphotransferase
VRVATGERRDDHGVVPAGEPVSDVEVPRSLRVAIGGRRARPVWENELGGLTFEVGRGRKRCYLKWAPTESGIDLAAEAARLRWARRFTPVPRLLAQGSDAAGTWIATAAIPGENAVALRWRSDPARAVSAIGEGLRSMHEALPVAGCPFDWSTPHRLADVRRRAADGRINPAGWHESHRSLRLPQALAVLAEPPAVDRLVVCHGDPCAPNTLISAEGRWSGHVDLGALGVADRWADLAVATWSTEWNYGPGWQGRLLAAYGVDPDPERTSYYRLLWDLGP